MAFRQCTLLVCLFLSGCGGTVVNDQTKTTSPDGRLNAGFLLIDGVYNSELMAPFDIFQHTIYHLEGGGMNVFTVAPSMRPVTTFEGLRILPDYTFAEHPPIDILVVASAEHNMDTDLEDEELINFVQTVGSAADYTLSLCDGAFVLAKAGLVDGRVSTTFPSDVARYRKTFPHLDVREGLSFVHDGPLLTSAGGAKSYDIALYLVHQLYGEKVAKGVGRGLVIDWQLSDYQYLRL